MAKLALLGGTPLRTLPFMSRPHIDELERFYLADCLDQKYFSRFVGSPVGDFRRNLVMPSEQAAELREFWSVLGGPYVRRFEQIFSARHKAPFAVSMNSCTSCLTASLIALGLGPGDEVITTPMSFTATATGLFAAGVTVRFADIDSETLCITPQSVERLIGPRTRAVVPVHLMGNAGHILELAELCCQKGLLLVEDSAQALQSSCSGQILGTIGAIGVFSFQESKNLMTGEGGMALTSSPDLAHKLRLIRNHGEAMVYDEDPPDLIKAAVGYNFRLPEPLAAIGLAQVQKIDYLNDIRTANTARLATGMAQFSFIRQQRISNDPDGFHPYCAAFLHDSKVAGFSRNRLAAALRAEGVPVATGFPRLMNQNPLFRGNADFTPEARRANDETCFGFFQIGYPNTANDMDDILSAIDKVTGCRDELLSWNEAGESKSLFLGR